MPVPRREECKRASNQSVGRPQRACIKERRISMPRAFILWPFFSTIKSAHSTLPYATGLKHTRPIVNHLSCPARIALLSLPLLSFPSIYALSSSLFCILSRRSSVSLRATRCTHIRPERDRPHPFSSTHACTNQRRRDAYKTL